MNYEPSFAAESIATTDNGAGSTGALHWIVDPAAALDAARRMEANCRSGLRFFSDFRRVRPLDTLEADDLDPDAEVVDDGFSPFEYAFNPEFARRA
jgi:hypothetical protein